VRGAPPSAVSLARSPRRRSPTTTSSKRVVAGPGDTIAIRDGHVIRNGKLQKESFIRPCAPGQDCNFPKAHPSSARSLVHDGRQPWPFRRQPLLGPVPNNWIIGGAFATYWPPGPDRLPLSGRDRAGPGASCSASIRKQGYRYVAGADEAWARVPGRSARGRRRAVRLRAVSLRDVRSLAVLNDSKQHTPERGTSSTRW
jgi:hypothetical protein